MSEKTKKFPAWAVGITLLYSTFVVIMISFLIFTRFQKVNLVSEDYYEKGLQYQQQIEALRRTQALLRSADASREPGFRDGRVRGARRRVRSAGGPAVRRGHGC